MRLFSLFVVLLLAAELAMACKPTVNGETYDFSSLTSSTYYTFSGGVSRHDRYHRGHHGEKYMYKVNFCKNVDRVAMNESACDEKALSPAYQITKESRYHPPVCFSLGQVAQTRFEPVYARSDDTLVTASSNDQIGVRVVYGGGEDCFQRKESLNSTGHTVIEWVKTDRRFEVEFLCDEKWGSEVSDFFNMIWEKGAIVNENTQCIYS